MLTIPLTTMLNAAGDMARDVLITQGWTELSPMYHLITDDGEIEVIVCPWTDDQDKLAMFLEVKNRAREINATQAVFISEAWAIYRKSIDEMIDADPPSQQPDRREIVFAVATDGKSTLGRSWQIVRDPESRRITQLVQDNENETRSSGRLLDGLLP